MTRRTSRERQFDFHLRVLAHMLQTAPWCRLPLTIRWLKQEYCRDFPAGLEPPLHMPVAFGQVRAVKTKGVKAPEVNVATPKRCSICLKKFQVMLGLGYLVSYPPVFMDCLDAEEWH